MLVTERFINHSAVMFHERRLRMGLKLTLDTPGNPPWSHSAASTPTLATTPFCLKGRTPTSLSAANTPASPSTHLDILQSLTLQGHTPVGTPTTESNPSLISASSTCSIVPSGVTSPAKSPNGPKAILPEELAKRMRRTKPFLLLDCRPEFMYRMNHIFGAVNVNISDRVIRRRLQLGKASMCDIMTTKEAKALYRKKILKEVVIYDENTMDWTGLPSFHPVQLLLNSLKNDGKSPAVLIGGLSEFRTQFPEHCEGSGSRSSPTDIPSGPLISPTKSPQDNVELEKVEGSQILPFLYLGNERDAADMQRLTNWKVTHILNVTSHAPCHFEKEGLKYKRLPASDSGQQNLSQYFSEAFEFIDLARKSQSNVLIHCQAGVSRSATIVVAYLMQHCNLSMNEAYSLVKNKRSVISPNFNFMGQLMEYENTLKTLKGGSGSNVVLPSPSGSQAKQPRILSIETSL